MPLEQDYKEFLRLLNRRKVEYLVIGGYAVGFHGYPRATNDLDIWVSTSARNAAKVVAALRAFGFDVPRLSTALVTKPGHILRMGYPPVRIEVMNRIAGVQFDDCHARSSRVLLDGVKVSMIALSDLRANKAAAGRLKDLSDLENLPGG